MQSSSYPRLCFVTLLVIYGCCTLSISSSGMEMNSSSSVRKKSQTSNLTCQLNIKGKSADCSSRQLAYVPQDLVPDIEKLNLQTNLISIISNTSFHKYSKLIELNLGFTFNSIFWINEGSFDRIVNLLKLYLYQLIQDSSLSYTYPETAFSGCMNYSNCIWTFAA